MPRVKSNQTKEVSFKLNGQSVSGKATPRLLLSDFLRHQIGATGTHVGCEHGVCGACTILLDGQAVRSCLTLAQQVDGSRLDTIEGGKDTEEILRVLRLSFKEHFALQCGFCTPGIIMTLVDYFRHYESASEKQIRELIGGHLCRCTGYTPIIKAALDAAHKLRTLKQAAAVENGG
jgi:2-furoyl-CoA dehydrogenase 2Fe-2S iron sulfur subunit